MDAQSQAILSDLFRKTSRSLLQYVRDSFPWTTPGDDEGLKRLHDLAAEEETQLAALGRFFTHNHRALPYPGSYPSSFTTINFISLEYLRKLLVDYQRQAIADVEAKLPLVHDPEARAQIQALLKLKRAHLTALEHLTKPAGTETATFHA
jgi:hypothetical protein